MPWHHITSLTLSRMEQNHLKNSIKININTESMKEKIKNMLKDGNNMYFILMSLNLAGHTVFIRLRIFFVKFKVFFVFEALKIQMRKTLHCSN